LEVADEGESCSKTERQKAGLRAKAKTEGRGVRKNFEKGVERSGIYANNPNGTNG